VRPDRGMRTAGGFRWARRLANGGRPTLRDRPVSVFFAVLYRPQRVCHRLPGLEVVCTGTGLARSANVTRGSRWQGEGASNSAAAHVKDRRRGQRGRPIPDWDATVHRKCFDRDQVKRMSEG